MTTDDIIRMAREAGYSDALADLHAPALERFTTLVAAAEREACAKVCESAGPGAGQIYCAFAIRARGNDAA